MLTPTATDGNGNLHSRLRRGPVGARPNPGSTQSKPAVDFKVDNRCRRKITRLLRRPRVAPADQPPSATFHRQPVLPSRPLFKEGQQAPGRPTAENYLKAGLAAANQAGEERPPRGMQLIQPIKSGGWR